MRGRHERHITSSEPQTSLVRIALNVLLIDDFDTTLSVKDNLAQTTGPKQSGVCGRAWKRSEYPYKCRTCERDPTCIICLTCFKSAEQEKAEARRQIPYHMHINLEFIETVHLTSAMLLEVLAMAVSKARGDVHRWIISKSFQYFLRNSMKQAFPVPPENTREYIMFATRCLMRGD